MCKQCECDNGNRGCTPAGSDKECGCKQNGSDENDPLGDLIAALTARGIKVIGIRGKSSQGGPCEPGGIPAGDLLRRILSGSEGPADSPIDNFWSNFGSEPSHPNDLGAYPGLKKHYLEPCRDADQAYPKVRNYAVVRAMEALSLFQGSFTKEEMELLYLGVVEELKRPLVHPDVSRQLYSWREMQEAIELTNSKMENLEYVPYYDTKDRKTVSLGVRLKECPDLPAEEGVKE